VYTQVVHRPKRVRLEQGRHASQVVMLRWRDGAGREPPTV
jgi:hypothetical protein